MLWAYFFNTHGLSNLYIFNMYTKRDFRLKHANFFLNFDGTTFEAKMSYYWEHDVQNSAKGQELKAWPVFVKGHVSMGLGPLHTRDWEPVSITLQALSLVEKEEPVQVHFALRLRDQRSKYGWKVYMDSYMESNGSCSMVTWTYLQKPSLGGRPNTRLGDHGTRDAHNHCLFYSNMCEDPHE